MNEDILGSSFGLKYFLADNFLFKDFKKFWILNLFFIFIKRAVIGGGDTNDRPVSHSSIQSIDGGLYLRKFRHKLGSRD